MPLTPWSGLGKPRSGEAVKAVAEKALGSKLAKEHFKERSSTALVEGEVLVADDARSIQVRWAHPGGQHLGKHSKSILLGTLQETGAVNAAQPAVSGGAERGTEDELCAALGGMIVGEEGSEEPPPEERLPPAEDPAVGDQLHFLGCHPLMAVVYFPTLPAVLLCVPLVPNPSTLCFV